MHRFGAPFCWHCRPPRVAPRWPYRRPIRRLQTLPPEEVVVTGSRIHQDAYSSSAAVDVVAPEKALQRGVTDLASALQTTTVASGSPQVTAASSTAFVQNGGIGTETLSLRGLGA